MSETLPANAVVAADPPLSSTIRALSSFPIVVICRGPPHLHCRSLPFVSTNAVPSLTSRLAVARCILTAKTTVYECALSASFKCTTGCLCTRSTTFCETS
jgi:hypothetical protein